MIKVTVSRLIKGHDLKQSIAALIKQEKIQAGNIASCVGCLSEVRIRLADGSSDRHLVDAFEIVSLVGTLTASHQHLHIAVADKTGKVIGGHLLDGCLINTTAELILHSYPDLVFQREFDNQTGYSELVASC
ncbi:PPC domain-containing DNA-binding protein [Vibrio ordalii]|uniref:PPC domain-containing DNA-binding protein n=1 Tax=Vibrio ordalii TaxID=28174 RepID=UPI0002482F8F|nr:PPC domain-containing DNA-binding protein [Vibrio ordalii]